MQLQKGEVYRCADENSVCEITVTNGAPQIYLRVHRGRKGKLRLKNKN